MSFEITESIRFAFCITNISMSAHSNRNIPVVRREGVIIITVSFTSLMSSQVQQSITETIKHLDKELRDISLKVSL